MVRQHGRVEERLLGMAKLDLDPEFGWNLQLGPWVNSTGQGRREFAEGRRR